MEFTVYTEDLRRAVRDLGILEQDLRRVTSQDTAETASFMEGRMKFHAPKASGALASGIHVTSPGRNKWEISAGKNLLRPYDVYQEMGYTPHIVHRSVLHPPVGGVPSRRGFVMVGIKTNRQPFVSPSLMEGAAFLDLKLRNSVGRTLGRFAR